MKKQLKKVGSTVKKHKMLVAAALVVVSMAGVSVYANQENSNLAHLQKAPEPKLDVTVATNKIVAAQQLEAKKQAEAKAAEEAAAKKAAEEAAAKVAADTAAKKKTTQPEKKKEGSTSSYEQVSVNLARQGGSVVATIGTSKPGTCYFTFKDYSDPNNPKYTSSESSASGGSCSAGIPAGSYTHAVVSYKAGDYSAKGSSAKIEL